MSQILNKVRDVDPNNSDAVKDVLSTFFVNLQKHTDVDCNRWLRALENIINRFPKYCGTHRNTIETYISTFIDSSNYHNVIEAAKCAHALQQVRPSQDKTATPKVCWREHLNILCNAAHKLIGALFPNTIDIYKGSNTQKNQLQSSATSPLYTVIAQVLSIPKTQSHHLNKQTLLGVRLRNILVFIQATLVEIFPVAKPIQPQLIIEVIVRALSISSVVKQAQDFTKSVGVKIQALRTLDALVACLGPNLIPYSALIFKFVVLTLKWCSENVNEETREVRRCAYDTLRRWLGTQHAYRLADSPRGRAWEDELTQHIIDDITPPKHIVQLTMSSQPTKHLSKKAKRKLANTMLQESSIGAHSSAEKNKVPISQESNDEIAVAALDCAETFLNVCGIFIKPTTHKLFQERLVRECYGLYAYSPARALGLLRTLDALRKNTPPGVPPPTQYCLRLYSDLVNSSVQEVSKFCSQALLDIRLHLHCSPPSLNFAIEVQSVPKKVDQPKKLSSRNRAALESLLGAERVRREITETESIIDLEGEPSKKKPRVESNDQVADQIIVSSESSSQISDDDDIEEVPTIDVDINNEEDSDIEEDVVDTGEINKSITPTTPIAIGETEDDSQEEQAMPDTIEIDSKEELSQTTSKADSKDKQIEGESQESTSKDDSQESVSKEDSQCSMPNSKENTLKESSEENGSTTCESSEQNNSQDSVPAEESMVEDLPQTQGSSTTEDTVNIHDAKTQVPLITLGQSVEDPRSPRSMEVEVAYDFPSTSGTKVSILEKTEDDNLSSTNDTDDVPITCGQAVKSSQELEIKKSNEVENKENEEPKMNGDANPEKAAENNQITESNEKITANKEISVEDMLADFVDETIEENKAGV